MVEISQAASKGELSNGSGHEPIGPDERKSFTDEVAARVKDKQRKVSKKRVLPSEMAKAILTKTVDARQAHDETAFAAYKYGNVDVECSVMAGTESTVAVTTEEIVRTEKDVPVLTRIVTKTYASRPGQDWYDESVGYFNDSGFEVDDYIPQEGDNLFGQTLEEAQAVATRRIHEAEIEMQAMLTNETPSLVPKDPSAHIFTIDRYNEVLAELALCTDATYVPPRPLPTTSPPPSMTS